MPAHKLTTTLYVTKKFDVKWKSWLQENDHKVSEQILNAENAREQIDCLKKIQKWIDGTLNVSSTVEANVEKSLNFLVHLFFIATNKNPIRRVLISYFQNLPAYVKNDIVGPQIRSELLAICTGNKIIDPETKSLTAELENNQECRHCVSTVGALIENFVLGEECVSAVCVEVLSYLGIVQEQFLNTFSTQLSPVQKNETMHHCMETAKLANRICQRTSVTLEVRLQQPDTVVLYLGIVKKLVKSDLDIILNDEFLFDCKTTSAMNLCQMLKYTELGNQLLNVLCETVFKHCIMASEFQLSDKLPEWLSELGLNRLCKDCLNSSTYLCVCYGVLSMVAIESLLHVKQGRCFLLDVLLPEFLDLSKIVTDVGGKLLAAKSLYFLTQRIRTYLTKRDLETVDSELCKRLDGDAVYMTTLLEFIWTSWEDTVEAVRFTVKDIFENVVGIHQMVSNSTKDDPFLGRLTVSILNDVNWSCKGKYGTLSVLVRHIGSTRMLQLNPGIADQILQQLEEQTLCCYVRDLYDELCSCHLKELKMGNQPQAVQAENQHIDWSLWFNSWVEPVIDMLCQSTPLQKKHLIEYVLPKLLKTDDKTLSYMIQTLCDRLHSNHRSDEKQIYKGDQLGALIMCVRRSRVMGLLKNQTNSKGKGGKSVGEKSTGNEVLFGVVDVNLLKHALVIRDDQIRLDAFALLCESQKTTELITDAEIQMIQTFIPQNMTNQNPAFRQLMLSYMKKFFSRMRESMQVLFRQISKMSSAKDHITTYQSFLKWVVRCMFDSLYPGSNFPRRATALNALSVVMDTFGGQADRFNFYKEVQTADIQSLLHCLTDTFEDNKTESSRILISCFQQNIPSILLDSETTKGYFDLALTLGMSSRPQDGLTGAYLLRVLINQPDIWVTLKLMASSKYEANMKVTNTGSVTLADSDSHELPPFYILLEGNKSGVNERKFLLLWILLKCLEEQLMVASNNLLVAAANRPLYPTMLCIRYCLSDIQFRNIDVKYYPCWNDFLSQLISLCLKISEIVSPVVHNCSPEGNIPDETLKELSRQTVHADVTQSEQTVLLMPEYLTVCCWRSVKEISLILGQLTADLPPVELGSKSTTADLSPVEVGSKSTSADLSPVEVGSKSTTADLSPVEVGSKSTSADLSPVEVGSKSTTGFLSFKQILSIGEYFTTQLLESKHRGAFELAYTGFIKVTEMLWRSNIPEFHGLPKSWLSEVMKDVMAGDSESRLCATRRSAGVPFYVQAIVSTEPTSTGRACFKDTMVKLIDLAYSNPSQESCNPKVHALNILRMLYKDSRLKDDVTPYLADGLKVAILGFKSNLWAVRNAATLLMAAMMNRVFGVKRSKDESSLSRKNCQTGKTFFFKYPMLYQFLLDELSEATENIGSQLHPGLYPILMVLGRLFPSTMEGTDTTLNLAAFIPFVVRCCSSPVLKTRMMAAKALQPLVEKNHVIKVFSELLDILPSSQEDGIRQNQVHGVLLQLKYLLNIVPMLSTTMNDSLKQLFCPNWIKKMDFLISRLNPCLLTRTCALEISADVLDKFSIDRTIHSKLLRILSSEVADISISETYLRSSPCLSEFMCTVCNLYIQLFCTSESDPVLNHRESNGNQLKKSTSGSIINSGIVKDNKMSLADQKTLQQNLDEQCLGLLFSFEEICLKILRSTSYEVRTSFLRKVTELCSNGNNIGGDRFRDNRSQTEEPKSKDGGINSSVQNGFLVQLSNCGRVYMLLLELSKTETRPECLVEIFRLLEVYPNIYCDESIDNQEVIQTLCYNVINTWLERLVHQHLSEEVLAACVGYLGTSLPTVCTNGRSFGGAQPIYANPLALLEKFVSIIRDFCCAAETAVSIQLACAKAIVTVSKCDILASALRGGITQTDVGKVGDEFKDIKYGEENRLKYVGTKKLEGSNDKIENVTDLCEDVGVKMEGSRSRGGDIISDTCIQNLYMAVFDLLQVDDIDVKDTIADVMLVVSETWTRGAPQSYICTSLLMEYWLSHSPDLCLVTSSLLQHLIESREPDQKQDERLFDRGEMNTYRDEIDFLQIVDKMMMKIFRGEKKDDEKSCQDNQINNIAISMATKHSCDKRLCDTLLPVILTNIQPKVEEWTNQGAFLDISKHEKWVIQVYKNLLLFKYGLLLAGDSNVHIRLLDTWNTFKNSVDLHNLPPLIVKCFMM